MPLNSSRSIQYGSISAISIEDYRSFNSHKGHQMKIHEYQGKELLKKFGVPVPRGIVARSIEEAQQAAKELGTEVVVVKAQIHAGGRGKGGGVKLAKSPEEAKKVAGEILGMNLITHQTGPEGREVRVLLIEEGLPIDKEFYLGIVLDRASGRPVFMASSAGGMDIEQVAADTPEKIMKETIDPAVGFRSFQARKLAFSLGLPAELIGQAVKFMQSLYTAYEQLDASLMEINPFLLTKDKRLIALDAKVNFDDNALFRHKDFLDLRDLNEEEPLEIEASKFDLNYIKLDGNIACMVNGAGLAMATMDIIKLAGGEPANFLDVGGGASQERVEAAFRILLADENVKAVLINIFGGIVRCDMVARGVVEAARKLEIQVPVVVRLEGTNVEEGQRVIRESGLNFTVATGMKDAAEKVVNLAA
ncbi:MAG TPA: ADP-forming succinate--CoA ligase subunit beta [Pyrinomonadaceae bacterium]|nr:ADP-forming succinate--CoA ligase subunit beta [Pyrinomonadaceae bacterium]